MALPGFIWFLLFKYVPLAWAVIAFRLFRPYPAQGKNYAYVEEEMSAIVELCRVGIVEELKRAGMGWGTERDHCRIADPSVFPFQNAGSVLGFDNGINIQKADAVVLGIGFLSDNPVVFDL